MKSAFTCNPDIFDTRSGSEFTSHSILVIRHTSFAKITEYFTDLSKTVDCNLVTFIPETALLSIANVREIQRKLVLKSREKSVLLVRADKFPYVTQNALLKLLEDGSRQTTLIIVTTPGVEILPTILSRVTLTKISLADELSINQEIVNRFIKADAVGRLEMWDEVNDSNSLGELALLILSDVSLVSPDLQSQILDSYLAWKGGRVLPKYFYEFLSLVVISPK